MGSFARAGALSMSCFAVAAAAIACGAFGAGDEAPPTVAPPDATPPEDVDAAADAPAGDGGCDGLDSPDDCGVCGRACDGACKDGLCEPWPLFAANSTPIALRSPERLAVTTDAVYIADYRALNDLSPAKGGGVWRCIVPSRGQACTADYVRQTRGVHAVAPLGTTVVYGADRDVTENGGLHVLDGNIDTVVDSQQNVDDVAAIAPTGDLFSATANGLHHCVAKGCDAKIAESAVAVAATEKAACFLGSYGPDGGATDEGVFCASPVGTLAVDARPLSFVLSQIAMADATVAWAVGPIAKWALASGGSTPRSVDAGADVTAIDVDASTLYVATRKTITRYALADGAATPLVAGASGIRTLRVAGDWVYFTADGATAPLLYRVPKK